MTRFRKKPVVIEAHEWTGDFDAFEAWLDSMGYQEDGEDGQEQPAFCVHRDTWGLMIPTLEGEMRADYGDMIIRGVKGEFYPCKPDVFAATYEPVAAPAPVTEPQETAKHPFGVIGHEIACQCPSCLEVRQSAQPSPPAPGERGETDDTPWTVGEYVEGKGYAIHKGKTDFGVRVIVGHIGWKETAERIVAAVNGEADFRERREDLILSCQVERSQRESYQSTAHSLAETLDKRDKQITALEARVEDAERLLTEIGERLRDEQANADSIQADIRDNHGEYYIGRSLYNSCPGDGDKCRCGAEKRGREAAEHEQELGSMAAKIEAFLAERSAAK